MNLTAKMILVTLVSAFLVGCATKHDDNFNWGHKAINYVDGQRK